MKMVDELRAEIVWPLCGLDTATERQEEGRFAVGA